MSLRNAHPLVWSPKGAMDTLESSTAPPGAMAVLQNLIPDPSTRDLWQCRPASQLLVDLALHGFAGIFVSCTLVIGTRIYGMVSSAQFPGRDEPFCYDVVANQVIPITGATVINTPVSPQQIGNWNPPVMTLVGTKIICAHPGFNGQNNAFFGVLETLNPAALTWTAQNTTDNTLIPSGHVTPLLCPPQWVANFGQRCYFLCNPPGGQPAAIFSDVLQPTFTTGVSSTGFVSPVLTFGDNVPLTCAVGLALFNQLGGIIQSLIIFKGVTNIFQVTGDVSNNPPNIQINSLNVATGTLSPNTVSTTTKGIIFAAPDGLRTIDFYARVSDPIGKAGDGITLPFFFSVTPSRANAAFNSGVSRIQLQNGAAPGVPQQEWWYDFVRDVWSGPHTTNISMIEAYNTTFLITIQGAGAKIFQSDQVQSNTSTFVENGQQLTWNFQTSFLPDGDVMAQVVIVESTVYAGLVTQANIVATAFNQSGKVLDSVTIQSGGQSTLWGSFTWGQAPWAGSVSSLAPRKHRWTKPLQFTRLSLAHAGISTSGVKLGRIHARYQVLGYLQEDLGQRMALILGIGSFTLNANTTQTVVVANCTTNSVVLISATTPDAANDAATTSIVPGNGQFTVTHANNPRADRTFDYQVAG